MIDESDGPTTALAERIAEQWVQSRRRVRWRWRVAAVGLVVSALCIAIEGRTSRHEAGSMVAQTRSNIEIGDRATIVAEPGAALAWVRESGSWNVRHTNGTAFYRVGRGDAFVVTTPEGTIEVVGTCFTVEVHAMNSTTKKLVAASGLFGLAAITTVVTLYEGDVVIASTDGSKLALEPAQAGALVAGQSARALGDAHSDAPKRVILSKSDATLRHQLGARLGEIDRLQAEVASLERKLEASGQPTNVPDEAALAAGAVGSSDSPQADNDRLLAQEALDMLQDEHGLAAPEREKLAGLLASQQEEIDVVVAAGERGEITWGDVHIEIERVVADNRGEIEGMLTPEQYAAYQAIRSEQYGPTPTE